MSYEQDIEKQNEELRRKLAECEAYKAACEPLFALLINCEKNLDSTSKFLNEVIESSAQLTAKQDSDAYGHIAENLELSKRCQAMYLEASNGLVEFQAGNWLDFYVNASSIKLAK